MSLSKTKPSSGSRTGCANPPAHPQPSEPLPTCPSERQRLSESARTGRQLQREAERQRQLLTDQQRAAGPSDAGEPHSRFDYLAQPKQRIHGCPLCGAESERTRTLSVGERYGLPVRFEYCTVCAFVFANPRMTRTGYTEFYRDGHYRRLIEAYSGDSPTPDKIWRGQQHHAQWLLDAFGPQLRSALAGGGTLLDLGGGPGGMAAAISQATGATPLVVEPSAAEVAYAREQGIDAVEGTAETWQSSVAFDVVLLIQTIDHLLDPVEVLRQIRGICSKLLIVDLVNFPDLYARMAAAGRPERALKIDHPSNFHPDALQAALLRSAFHPAQLVPMPNHPQGRQLVAIAAEPTDKLYADATPGPATVHGIIRGALEAHTWRGRYHAQPQ